MGGQKRMNYGFSFLQITNKTQHALLQFYGRGSVSVNKFTRGRSNREEYENTFEANKGLKFGVKDHIVNAGEFSSLYNKLKGKNKLVLSEIKNYHRIYKGINGNIKKNIHYD